MSKLQAKLRQLEQILEEIQSETDSQKILSQDELMKLYEDLLLHKTVSHLQVLNLI
jgi:hypothetical protein